MSLTGPLVLTVIDGWGCNDDAYGNAIAAARTPTIDRLQVDWPATRLQASGEAVGLPPGQQGNSEVGHLTIGAGRVLFQDLPRITRDIVTGAFFDNEELVAAVARARANGGTLHCLGLVSPGGVHSHQDHGIALGELARRRGLERVAFHVLTDGRDVAPSSGAASVSEFAVALAERGAGRIATVSGRYWAMDRDRRWDRTRRAYETLTGTGGAEVRDAVAYIREAYARGVTDEFIEPAAVVPDGGERLCVRDGDTVVFFNFRPDRARQLCHALADEHFEHFPRTRLADISLVTFTEYERGLTPHVAFPKETVRRGLAEMVAVRGLRQFHVAETEKYAHVTYFFNGGREVPFDGEERLLIPSPRVATYDMTPTMSAVAITDAVVDRVHRGGDTLVVINYANPDMVGHTGEFEPTVAAVECVDSCIARVAEAVAGAGGVLLITADHGNAELKIDRRDGSALTAHTTSPVPLLVIGAGHGPLRGGGGLSDVAPTALALLGIPVPEEMTGNDLLGQHDGASKRSGSRQ